MLLNEAKPPASGTCVMPERISGPLPMSTRRHSTVATSEKLSTGFPYASTSASVGAGVITTPAVVFVG